jgi:hypothetical protein
VSLNPGPHTFMIGAPGTASVETRLVLREAEKDRREAVSLTSTVELRAPTGIELSLRSGYGLPLGTIDGDAGGLQLGQVVAGMVPLWAEAGYRITPHLYAGAYFIYGFGTISGDPNSLGGGVGCGTNGISCSANDVQFGASIQYHFLSNGSFDPWIGSSAGYESARFSAQAGGGTAYVSATGFNTVPLEAGVDYRFLSAVRAGPFLALSLGEFFGENAPDSNGNQVNTSPQTTSLHEWLIFGIRGAVDIAIR